MILIAFVQARRSPDREQLLGVGHTWTERPERRVKTPNILCALVSGSHGIDFEALLARLCSGMALHLTCSCNRTDRSEQCSDTGRAGNRALPCDPSRPELDGRSNAPSEQTYYLHGGPNQPIKATEPSIQLDSARPKPYACSPVMISPVSK